jgi:hypothetical protein
MNHCIGEEVSSMILFLFLFMWVLGNNIMKLLIGIGLMTWHQIQGEREETSFI